MTDFVISPSSLSYELGECRACWWARHVEAERRPAAPFPSIFNRIDGAMKRAFEGRDGQPLFGVGGRIASRPKLRSASFQQPGWGKGVVFQGYLDAVLETPDGGVIVVDYKTIHPAPAEGVRDRYWSQLAAYAWCLEHPAKGEPERVVGLGLLCWSPSGFALNPDVPGGTLDGGLSWLPVERDEERFKALLVEVGDLLNGPRPDPTPGCYFCEHRELVSRLLGTADPS
jgi:hypothetical protein